MIGSYATMIQDVDQPKEERREIPTSVFSEILVSNRYEIDTEEMRLINRKIERSKNFEQGWNGLGTYPPSIESINTTYFLLNSYNDYLTTNLKEPASVQAYPLNEGGFGIELITTHFILMFKIANEDMNRNNYQQIVHYFLTDDDTYEDSGEVFITNLYSKFLQLHS